MSSFQPDQPLPESGQYVFKDHKDEEELLRLQVQEQVFDTFSKSALLGCGLQSGNRCLDVGVGAGSMARWMAGVVVPDGSVVGVDIDDRFFALTEDSGVELVKGDIRELEFPAESFDVVHTRLLLTHLPDRADVVSQLAGLVKPDGALVAVDIDMSWLHPTPIRPLELWQRRNDAVLGYLNANTSADFTVGSALPKLLADAMLTEIEGFEAAPLLTKGSPTASLLVNSIQSAERMGIPQGLSQDELIELHSHLTDPESEVPDRTAAAAGFTIVAAWGKRPPSNR